MRRLTIRVIFILTGIGGRVLVFALQPKSGFLPGAVCGRPKFPSDGDGANETGQPVSRPLSRPSPTANLAGNWKGDPLIREVRGLKFTPKEKLWRCRVQRGRVVYWGNYARCYLYRNGRFVFCGLRVLCGWLRKTLIQLLWKTSFLESFPSRFALI
jgi:hypothetical protein